MLYRKPENPIIHPRDIEPSLAECQVHGVYNPGAVLFHGETILLLRVEQSCKSEKGFILLPYYKDDNLHILRLKQDDPDLKRHSSTTYRYKGRSYPVSINNIWLARSGDGINFNIESTPFIYPTLKSENLGVGDARVVKIGDLYYITYTAFSYDGYYTALATTPNFRDLNKEGVIFPPMNNNVVFLADKVGPKYGSLYTPSKDGIISPSIWYSTSPDLLHWGNHKCLLRADEGSRESQGVCSGCPPIKTRDGWLVIFNAIGDDSVYSLNLLLLDLNDPSRILRRGNYPILMPRKDYEKSGNSPNVIFSNGVVPKPNGQVWIYYGACNESICLAITSIYELMEQLNI